MIEVSPFHPVCREASQTQRTCIETLVRLVALWSFTGAWNSSCLWKEESRMGHYLVTPLFCINLALIQNLLTYYLLSPLIHTPATCKVICISFSPADQVSDLFTFSLFWNTASLILKVLFSLSMLGFLFRVICLTGLKIKPLISAGANRIDRSPQRSYWSLILNKVEEMLTVTKKSFLISKKCCSLKCLNQSSMS